MQGVGFRAFVQDSAAAIGLTGWVRNLDDGTVEACAAGTPAQLSEWEECLWRGPLGADVRDVNGAAATLNQDVRGFRIR